MQLDIIGVPIDLGADRRGVQARGGDVVAADRGGVPGAELRPDRAELEGGRLLPGSRGHRGRRGGRSLVLPHRHTEDVLLLRYALPLGPGSLELPPVHRPSRNRDRSPRKGPAAALPASMP